jgi:hypothetical protein
MACTIDSFGALFLKSESNFVFVPSAVVSQSQTIFIYRCLFLRLCFTYDQQTFKNSLSLKFVFIIIIIIIKSRDSSVGIATRLRAGRLGS